MSLTLLLPEDWLPRCSWGSCWTGAPMASVHGRNKDQCTLVAGGVGTCHTASAAFEVGYESANQFSREYKRFFAQSPMTDVKARRVAELPATA